MVINLVKIQEMPWLVRSISSCCLTPFSVLRCTNNPHFLQPNLLYICRGSINLKCQSAYVLTSCSFHFSSSENHKSGLFVTTALKLAQSDTLALVKVS